MIQVRGGGAWVFLSVCGLGSTWRKAIESDAKPAKLCGTIHVLHNTGENSRTQRKDVDYGVHL